MKGFKGLLTGFLIAAVLAVSPVLGRAANTPNLSLQPVATQQADSIGWPWGIPAMQAIINANMTLIDTAVGANTSAIAAISGSTAKGTVFATGTVSATPSDTAGQCTDTAKVVANVTTAMTVLVSPAGAPTTAATVSWSGYPTAGNINVRLCAGATTVPAAFSYNYVVLR